MSRARRREPTFVFGTAGPHGDARDRNARLDNDRRQECKSAEFAEEVVEDFAAVSLYLQLGEIIGAGLSAVD